jgi:threonylcarbamoyladenosine tRNA methylthiotransferase MtaB
MPKFRIITLGCKVNQAESEGIAKELSGADWQAAAGAEPVDVCVVNTCAVTGRAAMQSRQAVRQAVHADPRTRVVVTGCYAQTDPQALARIEGVACVVDQCGKSRLPELIRRGEIAKGGGARATAEPPAARGAAEGWLPASAGNRTRPFLKIQDGCASFCTYCIVPYARGPSRSMGLAMAVERVAGLSAAGYQEVSSRASTSGSTAATSSRRRVSSSCSAPSSVPPRPPG